MNTLSSYNLSINCLNTTSGAPLKHTSPLYFIYSYLSKSIRLSTMNCTRLLLKYSFYLLSICKGSRMKIGNTSSDYERHFSNPMLSSSRRSRLKINRERLNYFFIIYIIFYIIFYHYKNIL